MGLTTEQSLDRTDRSVYNAGEKENV